MKTHMKLSIFCTFIVLMTHGMAQGVRIEFDNVNSEGYVWLNVNTFAGSDSDSDSWLHDGIEYSNDINAYASELGASATATSSVVSSASDVYLEIGQEAVIYDFCFYQNCRAFPYWYTDEDGNIHLFPASFSSNLEAEGTLYWKLLPSSEDEEIGTEMVVLLDPFYSVGSYSGFVTYEMGIYDWEWELGIGPTVFGPYHVITYCPSDGDCGILNNYPHGQELSVIARIGDTIRLSYHIEVDGNTTPGYPFASSNYGQEDSPSIWMPIYISLWKLPDLIAEFLDTGFRYPPDPGADLQAEVKLLITNIGEAATQPEQVIDMVFFLRPMDALDGSQDILVSAINNILIDELAPGRSKRIRLSVPFYIPASTYGTYRLGAYIDSSNDVAESNEHNNVITSNAIISISGGIPVRVPDLTGEISKISFRDSPMAGAIGRAAIDVNNIGTGATASKQVIDIEICLRAADATDDTGDITLLTLEDQSISKLAPGSSKTFRTPFNLPAVLGAGEYLLVAKIDSSEVVVELNENNNEALSEHFVIE